MSELTDFLAEIEAEKERVAQFAARLAETAQILETAKATAAGLGSDDVVGRLARVETELEQMETGRAVLEGSLEKARIQVDAAIYGNPIGSPGGGPKTAPEGLDAVPPHVRHGRGPSGDELMGNDPNIGPFQKEHENAKDSGVASRFQRLRNVSAKNIEDLKSGGEALVSGANADIDSFKPADPSTYSTTTQVPDYSPQLHSPPHSHPTATDLVGTAVVVTVVVADAAGRLYERIRRNRNGG